MNKAADEVAECAERDKLRAVCKTLLETDENVAAAVDEAADALQTAIRSDSIEECFFVIGGVAAALKRLAMDLR